MKKLLLIVCWFLSLSYCSAQTDAKADCIYSEKGFVIKRGSFKTASGVKRNYAGLYTPDGKVCIRAWETGTSVNNSTVAPGTEVLVRNSCIVGHIGGCVIIPKSVKYISPDAINSRVWIYDDSTITAHNEEIE